MSSLTHKNMPELLQNIPTVCADPLSMFLHVLFSCQAQPKSSKGDLSFPSSRVEMQTLMIKTDRLERRNSRS